MPIAIGTILIFSLFANSVGKAGPIGMGEALIRRRELPARRGRVRQNGHADGGSLRRFGPNSSPGQV